MVFVSNTIQYNTIQYNTIQYNTIQYNTIFCIISWFQNRVYFLGFSTPEQGGKFKTPVAHTRLIKVESPPGRRPHIGSYPTGANGSIHHTSEKLDFAVENG